MEFVDDIYELFNIKDSKNSTRLWNFVSFNFKATHVILDDGYGHIFIMDKSMSICQSMRWFDVLGNFLFPFMESYM